MIFSPFSVEIVPIRTAAAAREGLLNALSPQRRQRISAYSPERGNASLAADALARALAGKRLGLPPDSLVLSETEHGQPCFPGLPLWVSISHAGDYAAAAVADAPIGLDIERLRQVSEGVYRRVLDDTEQDWVNADPALRDSRFLRLWTMKEAFVKLLGQGFWEQPLFHAGIADGEPVTVYEGFRFTFLNAPEGYVLTLCRKDEA